MCDRVWYIFQREIIICLVLEVFAVPAVAECVIAYITYAWRNSNLLERRTVRKSSVVYVIKSAWKHNLVERRTAIERLRHNACHAFRYYNRLERCAILERRITDTDNFLSVNYRQYRIRSIVSRILAYHYLFVVQIADKQSALIGKTVYKSIVMSLRAFYIVDLETVNLHILRIVILLIIAECVIVYACHVIRYRDVFQRCTAEKRLVSYSRHAVRYYNRFKWRTAIKCIISDIISTWRYRNLSQLVTVLKRFIVNICNAVRNNNTCVISRITTKILSEFIAFYKHARFIGEPVSCGI